jgi:hypothetical protein
LPRRIVHLALGGGFLILLRRQSRGLADVFD